MQLSVFNHTFASTPTSTAYAALSSLHLPCKYPTKLAYSAILFCPIYQKDRNACYTFAESSRVVTSVLTCQALTREPTDLRWNRTLALSSQFLRRGTSQRTIGSSSVY